MIDPKEFSMTKSRKTGEVDTAPAKLDKISTTPVKPDEVSDRELDKVTGGMRKAGGDPSSAGKPF
jgi:hypothetical protein